ncbi:MAG TPA: hypothetical protein VGN57_06800 [Pirellulaceae bacterium]|jgi:hypothetical protein|nr:hypothetical protein [Pirellulaceae bacterium]
MSFSDPLPVTEASPSKLPGTASYLGTLAATTIASVAGGAVGLAAGFFTGHPAIGLEQGLGGGCLAGIVLVAIYSFFRPWGTSVADLLADAFDSEAALAELSPRPILLFGCLAGIILATSVGGAIGAAAGYVEFVWLRSPNVDEPALNAINFYLFLIRGGTQGLAVGCGAGLAFVGLLLWQRSR